jgi:SAM-dependent methyltransferase
VESPRRQGCRRGFLCTLIEVAQQLAAEQGLDTQFICSDVYSLPAVLNRKFDIVFTSFGVLAWLPDLEAWADVVKNFLAEGGTFYIVEIHPAGMIYKDELPLTVEYPYFQESQIEMTTTQSYADRTAKTQAEKQYQWHHTLASIVSAVAATGLRIEFLHEFPQACFQRYRFMNKGDDGFWHLPNDELPMLFSLKATQSLSS